ncbi:hypothetical protein Y032_0307g2024 [Ancylostoma ceylanicum]|uniref:Uncharacterized protein n=1 Tax=Ancylostoma ceylanicum TaxID=53326 RepID=A0A016S2Q3_9BILA|nr:hypothetical protein Y032_0307g2024 [Ancylostoma ceylanicum]
MYEKLQILIFTLIGRCFRPFPVVANATLTPHVGPGALCLLWYPGLGSKFIMAAGGLTRFYRPAGSSPTDGLPCGRWPYSCSDLIAKSGPGHGRAVRPCD